MTSYKTIIFGTLFLISCSLTKSATNENQPLVISFGSGFQNSDVQVEVNAHVFSISDLKSDFSTGAVPGLYFLCSEKNLKHVTNGQLQETYPMTSCESVRLVLRLKKASLDTLLFKKDGYNILVDYENRFAISQSKNVIELE